MKKKIVTILAIVFAVGSLSAVAVSAASNPADNVRNYSYNSGRSFYAAIQEKYGYSDTDAITNGAYSFNAGKQSSVSRQSAYEELPENATDEELALFYGSHNIGSGSAYVDDEYEESAKSGYGFNQGRASYQQWHASFGHN